MVPEGSLLHSQAPVTCLYPEPGQSPAHVSPPHLLKIHFNIILTSLPRSSKWSLIILDLITQIIFGEEYRAQVPCYVVFSTPHYLFPPRPKYLQHPVLRYPQLMFLSQCGRPRFTPIQTTGKITVLYILIFIFLDSKLEDKIFFTE